MDSIQHVAVLGAGIMGSGIGQVAAQAGFDVAIFDTVPAALDRSRRTVEDSLERFVRKGTITARDAQDAVARMRTSTTLEETIAGAEYVIEAVPEVLSLKRDLFRRLDELCDPRLVLATNTSQFSVTSIASAAVHRERIIGTHYFNPAVLMTLVEIVRGVDTSDEAVEQARAVNERMGKDVVVCRKDSAGFITSRLAAAQLVEACRLYDEGVASIEDIDKAMRLGFRHPMGPFELSDFTGLDTSMHVCNGLTEVFGDRFRPTQILRQLVESGYLGRKTGRGWYRS